MYKNLEKREVHINLNIINENLDELNLKSKVKFEWTDNEENECD